MVLVIGWRCTGIKSLYTRVVLIFIGIVMLSLEVGIIGSNMLYKDRIHNLIVETLIENGEKIIHAYQTTPSAELVPFMQNFSGLAGTRVQLYDKDGKQLLQDQKISVNQQQVGQVLKGKIVDNIHIGIKHLPIIGVPFRNEGDPFALFLTIDPNSVEDEMMNSIHFTYLIILFFGSFLILLAARYIVNPIVRLTEATRGMAKGKFDLKLSTKRKDEIGVLTTSFQEMSMELAKLDRMRQEFVASVSHEIQSPLTSISGFSKALKHKKMSEEDRKKYLTIIEVESERLSRLSQNLLRLSSLQQELQLLNVGTYRLDEQLRNVVIALEPQWTVKEIEIDVQLDPITIQADEDQLKQVWMNLLGNSIKFTPVKGRIVIESEVKRDQVSISITDNGIGIPEEERVDIFKPFHKVDKSRDPSVKGNGLGLSIVKQIVDIHQGEIEVSGAKGTGTTFTITLRA